MQYNTTEQYLTVICSVVHKYNHSCIADWLFQVNLSSTVFIHSTLSWLVHIVEAYEYFIIIFSIQYWSLDSIFSFTSGVSTYSWLISVSNDSNFHFLWDSHLFWLLIIKLRRRLAFSISHFKKLSGISIYIYFLLLEYKFEGLMIQITKIKWTYVEQTEIPMNCDNVPIISQIYDVIIWIYTY